MEWNIYIILSHIVPHNTHVHNTTQYSYIAIHTILHYTYIPSTQHCTCTTHIQIRMCTYLPKSFHLCKFVSEHARAHTDTHTNIRTVKVGWQCWAVAVHKFTFAVTFCENSHTALNYPKAWQSHCNKLAGRRPTTVLGEIQKDWDKGWPFSLHRWFITADLFHGLCLVLCPYLHTSTASLPNEVYLGTAFTLNYMK